MRTPTRHAVLAVFLSAAVPLTAQSEEKGRTTEESRARQVNLEKVDEGQVVHSEAGDGSVTEHPGDMPPEELDRLHRRGMEGGVAHTNLASPLIAQRPRRLGPGESGEMVVVLTLHPTVVMLPGTQVKVVMKPGTGPLSFGPATVDAPGIGTLEGAYKGKRVHDDTVTVRVPVSVQSQAKFEKYIVHGSLSIGLTRADGGQTMQKTLPLDGRIWVGKPMAKLRVLPVTEVAAPAAGQAGPVAGVPAEASARVPAAKPAQADPEAAADTGAVALDPKAAAEGELAEDGGYSGYGPADSGNQSLLIAGGVSGLALLLLLLLFRRKG